MNNAFFPAAENEGINVTQRLFIISADLGQACDYTAISVIERIITGPGVLGVDRRGETMLYLRHIERMREIEYPTIVNRLAELYKNPQLAGVEKAVVIDFTGLGRPVYDLMKQAGFRHSLNGISITGGVDATYNEGHFNVPKRELVSNLQIQLQNDRLKIAKGLKEANALIEELSSFQTKISDAGRDTYGGRRGVHDDIVMSVAMGAWIGCKKFLYRIGDDRFM